MSAVKIPPQRDPSLGFDLDEVMAAVGDQSHLVWRLRDAELVAPGGIDDAELGAIQAASDEPEGCELSWAEMQLLAARIAQVIDGTFTGYDKTGRAHLQLAAIDSSFWVVWAMEDDVLARVSHSFTGVEAHDEPAPDPLWGS